MTDYVETTTMYQKCVTDVTIYNTILYTYAVQHLKYLSDRQILKFIHHIIQYYYIIQLHLETHYNIWYTSRNLRRSFWESIIIIIIIAVIVAMLYRA